MSIKPGQKIAIVGENGAGKSTLTKLLLRLYDTSSGDILINGNQSEITMFITSVPVSVSRSKYEPICHDTGGKYETLPRCSDENCMKSSGSSTSGVLEKFNCGLESGHKEFDKNGIVLRR